MIEYRAGAPEEQQFFALFETTGWNANYQATPQELSHMLANTWYMLAAYDGERLVGFGRVVSDLVLHAMIYDMIVAPDYQGQGIGGEIDVRQFGQFVYPTSPTRKKIKAH